MKALISKIFSFISLKIIAPINFNWIKKIFRKKGKYWDLTEEDWAFLQTELKEHYFIILNYRKTHLTTPFICFMGWVKTGKWASYTHAFMNVEGDDINSPEDFLLMEATAKGTHFSKFKDTFDCDSVCLLLPKGFTKKDWTETIDKLLKQEGKPYDTLFDFMDDKEISCSEMVRVALQGDSDYLSHFPHLEAMIKKYDNNLTPQMFRDCPDFEVFFEVKR